jgi:hypothetical protein
LHELGGGRTKRDLKRAFAIVEAKGMTRFVVAGSDTEYSTWVRELHKAISSYSGSPVATLQPDLGTHEGGELVEHNVAVNCESDSLSQSPRHGQPLGRSLSRAAQVAKAASQAVAGRSRRKEESADGLPDESTITSSTVAVKNQEHLSPPSVNTSVDASNPSVSEDATGPVSDRFEATPLVSMPSTEETSEQIGVPNNRRLQIRSKFAGVGQGTKSRFGSVLQAAKQKGRAVADKGREVAERRRQHGIDDTDGPPVASTLEPPKTVGDSNIQGNADTGDQSPLWACLSCTFVNPAEKVGCQMCGIVRDQGEGETTNVALPAESQTVIPDATEALDDNIETDSTIIKEISFGNPPEDYPQNEDIRGDGDGSIISDFADDLDPEGQGPRRGMRERMGAAVRSVRQGKDDQNGIPRNNGRFSLRRRGNSALQDNANGKVPGAPSPVKLRNVMIKGPLDSPTHPFGEFSSLSSDLPLKRLEGAWFVQVTTGNSDEAADAREAIEAKQTLMSSPSSDVVVTTNQTNDASTEDHRESQKNDITEQTATSTIPSTAGTEMSDLDLPADTRTSQYVDGEQSNASCAFEPKNKLSFRVKVFQHSTETMRNRPVAEVETTLYEILHLHTELSESIARIPFGSSSAGNDSGRSSTEMMNESLATALGLTALDTVRITGRLLGGLLENLTREPDSEASLIYHGKLD